MAQGVLHEDLTRDDDTVGPSDRKFGLTIGGIFALIAIWKVIASSAFSLVWGGLAAVFLISALVQPALLSPLNRVWLQFGLLLHRIVSPIIMALLFFAAVLPVGLLMRAVGKDPLRLRLERDATTYWLPRSDDRLPAQSMRQQF
jgi:Saxitoxin biosynthesis operon protein SxtJ